MNKKNLFFISLLVVLMPTVSWTASRTPAERAADKSVRAELLGSPVAALPPISSSVPTAEYVRIRQQQLAKTQAAIEERVVAVVAVAREQQKSFEADIDAAISRNKALAERLASGVEKLNSDSDDLAARRKKLAANITSTNRTIGIVIGAGIITFAAWKLWKKWNARRA